MYVLQVLAVFQVGWNYLLPSVIFTVCYYRILVVVMRRQVQVSHVAASSASNRNASVLEAASRAKQRHIPRADASSDRSGSTSATNGAGTSATTEVSHRQMNILQTMILITISFTVLGMPLQLSILLTYFQVSLLGSRS